VAASGSMADLNLGGNSIGDAGAKALAAVVAASGSLTGLNFNHNKIGAEDEKALAEAFLSRCDSGRV